MIASLKIGLFFITLFVLGMLLKGRFERSESSESSAFPLFAWGSLLYLLGYLLTLVLGQTKEFLYIIWDLILLGLSLLSLMLLVCKIRVFPWKLRWNDRSNQVVIGFSLLLFAIWMLTGTGLEYPSDPWFHISEIQTRLNFVFNFNVVEAFSLGRDYDKRVNYLLFHWLLTPDNRGVLPYFELTLLGACLSVTLLISSFQLMRVFTSDWRLLACYLLCVLLFFGNSSFSFFRYYIFGGNGIAFLFYLESVACLMTFALTRKWLCLALSVFPLPLCWVTHQQELLLYLINLAVAILFILGERLSAKTKLSLCVSVSILAGFSLALLWALPLDPINSYANAEVYFRSKQWGPLVYQHHSLLRTLQILGLPGMIAMMLAILLWFLPHRIRQERLLALLCLTPVGLLYLPWALELLLMIGVLPEVLYRILFASNYLLVLSWFPVVIGLCVGAAHRFMLAHPQYFTPKAIQQGLIGLSLLVLVGLGLNPYYPVYGRFRQLVYQTGDTVNGQQKMKIGALLDQHRHRCNLKLKTESPKVLTDQFTGLVLRSLGTYEPVTIRRYDFDWLQQIKTELKVLPDVALNREHFAKWLNHNQVCFVVLAKQISLQPSWMMHSSGHWGKDDVYVHEKIPAEFFLWLRQSKEQFVLIQNDESYEFWLNLN